MKRITVTRDGYRTWYGRATYAVTLADETGKVTFHGYSRRAAEALARILRPIVGLRPVGALANMLAREIALREPAVGEEWTARL